MDFYFCSFDGEYASVLVDLSLFDIAPDANRPTLLSVKIKMRSPNTHGLSSIKEGSIFDILSETLITQITARLQGKYAGRITRSGRWEFYFYASSSSGVELVVSSVFKSFSEYLYAVDTKEDPEWSFYLSSLFPNGIKDKHQILNQKMINELRATGVDLTAQHEVVHKLIFDDHASIGRFKKQAEPFGFIVKDARTIKGKVGATLVELSRIESLDIISINQTVLKLIDMAEEVKGKYDGWEVAIRTR